MAEPAEITRLREMIGEIIVSGQTEADTLFTDATIESWIDEATNLNAAAVTGWEAKMAQWANLVDVTDGAASRKLGDLMDHALAMIARYGRLAEGLRSGRSRVGKISRT